MNKSATSKKAMPAKKMMMAPKGKATSMMMSKAKKGSGGKMNGSCPY